MATFLIYTLFLIPHYKDTTKYPYIKILNVKKKEIKKKEEEIEIHLFLPQYTLIIYQLLNYLIVCNPQKLNAHLL